eukprot:g4800.t1
MNYYGYNYHGAYPGYHPSQNWSQGPPPSAPPSTGKIRTLSDTLIASYARIGTPIQFGSFPPTQMDQHGYPPPMYGPTPYPTPYGMPMMPQPYAAYHPHMTHQQGPTGGPPPPRGEGRMPRKHEGRPRSGPPVQHRDREHGPRETPSHQKTPPMNEEHRRGETMTPTQGHRETSPGSYTNQQPQQPQPQQQQQSVPAGMTPASMQHHHHPSHAMYPPQMPFYPYPHGYHHAPYVMPPVEAQMDAQQTQYQGKGGGGGGSTRLQLEPNLVQRGNAPVITPVSSQNQDANDLLSPKSTATTTGTKKRLQFVNPETHAPLENLLSDQMTTTTTTMTTPLISGTMNTTMTTTTNSSRPSSPGAVSSLNSDVGKLVSEVMLSGPRDRTVTSRVVSRVRLTEVKTPDSVKKPVSRGAVQISTGKKIIDPSNGAYQPGSIKSETHQKSTNLDTTSFGAKVLNTVESIERRVEEDNSKETEEKKKADLDTPVQKELATEPSIQPPQRLILDRTQGGAPAKKKPETTTTTTTVLNSSTKTVGTDRRSESVARVIIGSRMVAATPPNVASKIDDKKGQVDVQLAPQIAKQDTPHIVKSEAQQFVKQIDVQFAQQQITKQDPPSLQLVRQEEEQLTTQVAKTDELQFVEQSEGQLAMQVEKLETPVEKPAGEETDTQVVKGVEEEVEERSPESDGGQTPNKVVQFQKEKKIQEQQEAPILEFTSQLAPSSSDVVSSSPMKQPQSQLQSQQQQVPKRTGSGKLLRSSSFQAITRKSSSNSIRGVRSMKLDPSEVFHTSSGNRRYSLNFLRLCKDKFTDKPGSIDSLACMKDFEGTGLKPSRSGGGSDKWPKQSMARGSYEDRGPGKASLSRNSSGRDWQKESSRSGGNVVKGRLGRQYSGPRGEEGGKWGKSDLNMMTPFASGSTSGGIGLHRTENKYIVGGYQTDDREEEKRQKTFKGLLNKLTPDNFEKMFEKFKEIEISDPKTLRGLIDQIFDKALIETTFCPLYSDLCKLLTTEMPEFEEEGDKRRITFRRLLLNKCQAEYEKGDAAARAEKNAKDENATISEEDRMEKLALAKKERFRSLGNMQFIGFLFKKGMLTEKIIHNCILDLLREDENPKPEDIECLCKLVCTVGELLPKDKNLDAYFSRIDRLSKNKKLETRHRFMLIDLIELRDRRWVERREKEGPKTIEEIHQEALAEQQAQNARNRGSYGNDRNRETSSFIGRGRGAPWGRNTSTTTRSTMSFANTHEEVRPLTKNLSLGRTASSDISLRPSNMDSRGTARPTVVSMPRPKSPEQVSRTTPISEHQEPVAVLEGEELDRKVKALLSEYYAVQDLEEALRCIEELSEKNVTKSEILRSVLLTGLDIRGVDVEQRLKPIIPIISTLLSKKLFTTQDVKQGLRSALAALPEIAEDFPRAPVLIARMLGSLASSGVVPLRPLLDSNAGIILTAGRDELSEEDSPLIDAGYGSTILIEMLQQMKNEETEAGINVREALSKEETDLSLFYPFYLREEVDLSEALQFLDN